jgi:hypothetical protein
MRAQAEADDEQLRSPLQPITHGAPHATKAPVWQVQQGALKGRAHTAEQVVWAVLRHDGPHAATHSSKVWAAATWTSSNKHTATLIGEAAIDGRYSF